MSERFEITFTEGGVGLIETLATGGLAIVAEKGLDAVTGNDNHGWYCRIKDSETGLEVKCWGSTKADAQENAFAELKRKNEDFEDEQERERENAHKKELLQQKEQQRLAPASNQTASSDESGCATVIAWLVGIGIAVFVVVWLAVNVVLPVALLNSALAFVVLAFVFKKYKTLFASLALVGGGYMLLDITNGWLSVNFVEKVVKNPDWISAFVYINAFAIGMSTWLLIQPIWIKTEQVEPTEKRKSLLLKCAIILLVAIAISVAPIFYHSVQNPFVQKTIRITKLDELPIEKNEVIDFDGNIYHTVTIGTQVWMLENLKTTKFNDGKRIPNVIDNTEWINLKTPGYCWYNNDDANKNTYGALYNWQTINTGNLAPKGWHVPTDNDWTTLTTYLGGVSVAGRKLKEGGTLYWNTQNTVVDNSSGFTALPSGDRGTGGKFYYLGSCSNWWSSSESSATNAWYRGLIDGYNHVEIGNCSIDFGFGFSVRCIRDNGSTVLGNDNSDQNVDVTTLSNIEIEKKVEKPKDIIIERPIPPQAETNKINNSEGNVNQQEETDDTLYNVVEQMPEFPGGEAGLLDFLGKSVKYPAEPAKMGIEGKVYVSFVVEKDGTITELRIVRSVDPKIDAEALRVVKSFPKWIPGKQNGKVVKVSFTIPVNFKLK